jgi:hypothetical protein
MKELLKIAVILCLFYLVWNFFWRSTFLLWDLFGPLIGTFIVYLLVRRLFPSRVNSEDTSEVQSRCAADTQITEVTTAPTAQPQLPSASEFVQLVADMKNLEARCTLAFKESLKDRRDFRESRPSPPINLHSRGMIPDDESAANDPSLVTDLDHFLDKICTVYLEKAPEHRSEIRGLFDGHKGVMRNLNNYAGRTAQRLKSSGNMKDLMLGLAAASMDENQLYSDYEGVIGLLYLAAVNKGLQPAPYLKLVADMCGTDPCPIRGTLLNFENSEHFRVYVMPRLAKETG